MRKPKFISLAIRAIVPIVIMQTIVMSVAGFYYSKRFSADIDTRIKNQIEVPGILMNKGLLNFEALSKKETMVQIVGKDLIESMVIGFDKTIYYSMNSKDLGKNMSQLDRVIDLGNFDEATGSVVFNGEDSGGTFIANITPIYSVAGKSAFLFAYIKIGTETIESQKTALTLIFLLGSLIAVLVSAFSVSFLLRFVFLKNMQRLKTGVDMVKQGNLGEETINVLPKTNDELGILSQGFGDMILEVRKSREGLEEEVAKRTQELQISQKELVSKVDELKQLNDELGRINKLMTGRELKMIELKERIATLEKALEDHLKA